MPTQYENALPVNVGYDAIFESHEHPCAHHLVTRNSHFPPKTSVGVLAKILAATCLGHRPAEAIAEIILENTVEVIIAQCLLHVRVRMDGCRSHLPLLSWMNPRVAFG